MAVKNIRETSVSKMTGGGMQNVHQVMRTAHHPSNVVVRHPAHVGPHMLDPQPDHMELPSGAVSSTPPGGIIGGLAPFQNAKGAEMGDFKP